MATEGLKREQSRRSVAVVGGGLVGSLQASLLAKRGFSVNLYDLRGDIRNMKHVSGRSINLALSVRGREALKAIGIEEKVLKEAVPMHARMIHSLSGKMSAQPYGQSGQCIYSVDRRNLNETLLTEAESHPNVTLHFNHKLIRADLNKKTLHFSANDEPLIVETDFIFGCDGAYSTVRRQMMRWGRLNYEQEYIEHGYKELNIPPTADGGYALPPNYLHIWPRNEFMMIALPNMDGSFTVTLFMPFTNFDAIDSREDVLAFFTEHFPDSIERIGVENLVTNYFNNPTGRLISVKCYPHFMADSTVLLGDAAHAVVPFYGQGMNAGFEDCLIFYEQLIEAEDCLSLAAENYSSSHWRDCHAIADLSKYNYLEMRSHVNSRIFLLFKHIDKLLHTLFPRLFIPLYTMVAFTRTPYHQVVVRARRQELVVRGALITGGVALLLFLGGVVFERSGAYLSLRYRVMPCVIHCVIDDFYDRVVALN